MVALPSGSRNAMAPQMPAADKKIEEIEKANSILSEMKIHAMIETA